MDTGHPRGNEEYITLVVQITKAHTYIDIKGESIYSNFILNPIERERMLAIADEYHLLFDFTEFRSEYLYYNYHLRNEDLDRIFKFVWALRA